MVRMKNVSGGTRTVNGRDYFGNGVFDIPERYVQDFLRNRFELVSEEVESAPVVEETVEVEEASSEPSLDLESMTKRELQAHLKSLDISYKFSDSKATLLALALGEEE
jgi:hypothetical protein|tara:strand:+ start:740 stop:1063 length:324 start_codon:yes stop_codon:yes gene_type:complete